MLRSNIDDLQDHLPYLPKLPTRIRLGPGPNRSQNPQNTYPPSLHTTRVSEGLFRLGQACSTTGRDELRVACRSTEVLFNQERAVISSGEDEVRGPREDLFGDIARNVG